MSDTSLNIVLGLEDKEVKSGLDAVKEKFRSASGDIERSLGAIKGFTELKRKTEETAKAYEAAKQKVVELAREVKDGAGSKTLARDFDKAKSSAASLKTVLDGQKQELQRLRSALSQAGVSTGNLSGHQRDLRAELEKTKAKYKELGSVANARETLGLDAHRDIQSEIAKTRAAYATLAASGKLSMKEMAQAKVAVAKRIDELRGKTNGWKDALVEARGELALMVAAGAALIQSSRVAIRYEAAMADVRKTVGGTKEEINELGHDIVKMTSQIPMAADQLARIAANGGQLGIVAGDITKFTDVTAKMATAFDMTADAAGESIGKIKNVYKLGIDEIEGFGDTVNQLGNNMAAKEREIVDVMLRIGGSAEQFGLAKEATAALAASMLALGKPPEVAGTAINSLLNRMQTATMQSEEFQGALGRIGANAEEMAATVAADPQRALDDLLKTLSELDGQDRAEVLTGLFGREFQDDIGLLVGGLDTYNQAMDLVADKTQYAGAMNKEFGDKTDTTDAQLQLLTNNITIMANAIGEGLLPVINGVAGAFNTILTPVAHMMTDFPQLSALLVSIGTGFLVFRSGKKLVDILRLAIGKIGPTSVTSFGQAGAAATGFNGKIGSMTTKVKGLNGIIGKAGGLLAAFGVGWEVGNVLNNFSIVRKGGASLVYGLDRVRLAAVKMWRTLTGGNVEEINQQIENAKNAYRDVLDEIDRGQDDWSKKNRGETSAGQSTPDTPQPGESQNNDKPAPSHDPLQDEASRVAAEMAKEEQAKAEADRAEKSRARDEASARDKERMDDEAMAREDNAARQKEAREDRLDKARDDYEAKEKARAEAKKARDKEAVSPAEKEGEEQSFGQRIEAVKAAMAADSERRSIEAAETLAAHNDKLALLATEREEEAKAHEERLAAIREEAEAKKTYRQQQSADIEAELAELESSHRRKMEMLEQESFNAQVSGDKEAQDAVAQKIATENSTYGSTKSGLEKSLHENERAAAKDDRDAANRTQAEERAHEKSVKRFDDADSDEKESLTSAQEASKEQGAKAQKEFEEQLAVIDNERKQAEADEEAKRQEELTQKKEEAEAKEREKREKREADREERGRQREAKGDEEKLSAAQKAQAALENLQEQTADSEIDQVERVEDARAKATDQRMAREEQAASKAQSVFEQYASHVLKLSDDMAARNKDLQSDLIDLDPNASEETKWKKRAALAKEYEEQAKAAQMVSTPRWLQIPFTPA